MPDLDAARGFMDTHARTLDRRRFDLHFGERDAQATLAAVAAYRNADGGFGWGLEPDLRSPTSQPGAAIHAFEVFTEAAPARTPMAVELCDWLAAASLADGGVPFGLAGADDVGSAPWWAAADPSASSLHMTCAVAGAAHRVAAQDEAVRGHPWLARATEFCLTRIAERSEPGFAIEFRFVLDFLDAAAVSDAGAARELERLASLLPASATLAVSAGAEGERMRPLDLSPFPDTPLRETIDRDAIEDDLDELASEQRPDGGWEVDFAPVTPAAKLEWRGYITLHRLRILDAHGRL